MLRGYAELLRVRHVGRLLAGTLVGRLPNATAAFAIVLFVRAEGGSYTLGGILSGGYGLATAVGQPLLGRAVDLRGQPRVLLPSALLSAAGMALFAVVGIDPLPLACAAVLVAGLFTPPLEGALRALWPSVLKREDRVHGAYALDAVAQEVMFAVAPLIVTLLVATASEAAALLVLNALGVLGALWVVLSPPARRWRSEPREPHWLGALRAPGLLVILGAFFFVGVRGTVRAVRLRERPARQPVAGNRLLLFPVGTCTCIRRKRDCIRCPWEPAGRTVRWGRRK